MQSWILAGRGCTSLGGRAPLISPIFPPFCSCKVLHRTKFCTEQSFAQIQSFAQCQVRTPAFFFSLSCCCCKSREDFFHRFALFWTSVLVINAEAGSQCIRHWTISELWAQIKSHSPNQSLTLLWEAWQPIYIFLSQGISVLFFINLNRQTIFLCTNSIKSCKFLWFFFNGDVDKDEDNFGFPFWQCTGCAQKA